MVSIETEKEMTFLKGLLQNLQGTFCMALQYIFECIQLTSFVSDLY